MADLKLPALPDRTPVKMSIHVMPELVDALSDYAKMYAAAYGREEPVSALVPAMLEASSWRPVYDISMILWRYLDCFFASRECERK
ncbi:MAG: transposase [Novosphingobium lindaniclasticum]|jgi:hypothetical protein|uniref:DUF2274 domain-containing protein n=1 Tax=Novosphingobium lindaniclasticum TaxID=1329895 RepID=UPI00240A1A1E|nr:DUF2274 domain-containing protein [Novosphingobium lindaniclasticum]MDF2640638.1 transposase [Novosphingobium lindaniclasticum]